ncbi:MAG: MgtC/SapB family protein [Rhodoferax sp.]|nr:MgtC/SapB family protein [Rhodoferax sp.]
MQIDRSFDPAQFESLMIALGIGLLIGLERERRQSARAGLRTFGLVGLFGAVAALLSAQFGSQLPFTAGLIVIGAAIIAAYRQHPDPEDPGTTSVAALLVCYCLGAMCWFGYARIAIMLAIVTTSLLYFKSELKGIAARLERRDWISILQFAVLSLVILPILPNREFGPYGALNPYQVWLMVVLIAGVSLAGYAALQIVGTRYGAPLVGVLGGLVSSTATTLVFARNARKNPVAGKAAALVILIANLTMVLRVGVVAGVLAPALLGRIAVIVSAGLVAGAIALGWNWHTINVQEDVPLPVTRNPAELPTALGFGAVYAGVLLCAAWLNDVAGSSGLYAVALVSGLTDVDAISLSSLRLFSLGHLEAEQVIIAITLAMLANLSFKTALAVFIGRRAVGPRVLAGMSGVAAGLGLGLTWVMS